MIRLPITGLDHIVLNVSDIDRSLKFYTEVLGLQGERIDEFKAGKVGFPSVRINAATIIDLFPVKDHAVALGGEKSSGNLNHFCLVVEGGELAAVIDHLKQNQIAILDGPVPRWGARGRATSVYFLDPDGNEVEIRAY
jgi:catechol 2,3-dioxygenase-like lactoylglutathione lyase family enzyme